MDIKEIRDLILNNRVSDALKKLENIPFTREINDSFIQLNRRFVKLRDDEIKGLLSTQDKDLTSNNLINDLLNFLSTLEDSHRITNDITLIKFDKLFFNDHTLDELELFLHEFEMNLETEIDLTSCIVFEYEEILIAEMKMNDDRLTRIRLENTLGIFGAYKTDLVEIIKILLNNHLYYELTQNKPKQAIVLRSILEQFRGKRYGIIEKTKKRGFSTESLMGILTNYSKESSLNNSNFLNENDLKGSVIIDIFNKEIVKEEYSIRITSDEFEKLKSNLENYGEKDYLYLRLFMGTNAIEATRLSEQLIFERAIPKSIFIFYYKLKDKRITKEEFNLCMNFNNMYIGLGG